MKTGVMETVSGKMADVSQVVTLFNFSAIGVSFNIILLSQCMDAFCFCEYSGDGVSEH